MLIWFRIKALYAGAIAFGISFVWAMIAFGIFSSSLGDDALAAAVSPMWIFIFGLSLFLVDLYWHLPDPAAVLFFALFSTKTWGAILMLISIYASIVSIQNSGFSTTIGNILLFTIISAAALIGLYIVLKKRFLAKKPKPQN